MKSSSDHSPESTIQSNGKTQIRYNIVPFTRTMMDKEQTGYNYDYVEIAGDVTRAKVIDAIISDVYKKDAEIALINNEIANPGTPEYNAYQLLRKKAKEIAAAIRT
uniref:Uncharacterized protein n=1 Tax=viral metagenome TaxID=1070528 RepID=A0A6M3LGK3_9ZZZZ